MSYVRVLPRDLFNEANLLKCYGALWIALNTKGDKRVHFSEDDMSAFDIVQRDEDGATFIKDLFLIIHDKVYRLIRPLNSREPWPLMAENMVDSDCEAIPVFADDGTLSNEFESLIDLK